MTQPPPPSDKSLSDSQKAMMRKIKIGIGLVTLIVIIALVVWFFVFWSNQSDLEFVNFTWNDNHPWFSSAYVHVEGTIFNSGSSTAGNVQLITRIYDSQGTLLKTDTANIGSISAKEYKNINFDIQYSGDASRIQNELQYKPFG